MNPKVFDAIRAFRDEYIDKGPERSFRSALATPAAGLASIEAVTGDRHARAEREDRRSSRSDACSRYHRSSSIRSLQGSDARPFTCAQPVSPGLTSSRRRWRSVYWSTCTWIVGRGPTSDISPLMTLTRFGSSSIDVRRRIAPMRVIRVSPSSTTIPEPMCSAPETMVRSL